MTWKRKRLPHYYHTIDSDSEDLERALINEFEENQDSWKSFLGTEIPIKDRVWHDSALEKLVDR